MRYLLLVLVLLLAACAPTAPLLRGDARLHYIALELIPWISQQTGYPERKPPDFAFATAFSKDGVADDAVNAAYDDKTQLIIFHRRWQGNSPYDLSYFVHELVHHLQAGSANAPKCERDIEVDAYSIQLQWLAVHFPKERASKRAAEAAIAELSNTDCDQ